MSQQPVRLPASICPVCGYVLDAAQGIERRRPIGGDVSICFGCGELSLFGEDLRLRLPEPMELLRYQLDTRLWSQVEAAQKAVRARRR